MSHWWLEILSFKLDSHGLAAAEIRGRLALQTLNCRPSGHFTVWATAFKFRCLMLQVLPWCLFYCQFLHSITSWITTMFGFCAVYVVAHFVRLNGQCSLLQLFVPWYYCRCLLYFGSSVVDLSFDVSIFINAIQKPYRPYVIKATATITHANSIMQSR
jgi:hypothetical protein